MGLSNPKTFVLSKTREPNKINAIGDINKVSNNNPISDCILIFFLIKLYKLNVIATVIPIHGTWPNFRSK